MKRITGVRRKRFHIDEVSLPQSTKFRPDIDFRRFCLRKLWSFITGKQRIYLEIKFFAQRGIYHGQFLKAELILRALVNPVPHGAKNFW